MALTKMSTQVHNIQDLSDLPNVTDGLTSSQLKERFDKAGVDIKDYLNSTLTEELDTKLNALETQANSIASVVAFIQETMLSYLDIYPVGSIYISVNNTNPGTIFGGTWVQLKNSFLFATNATSGEKGTITGTGTNTGAASGNTGSTVLTAGQLPKLSGTGQFKPYDGFSTSGIVSGKQWSQSKTFSAAGGSQSVSTAYGFEINFGNNEGHTHTLNGHTHTIPHLEVYVWKRTA